MQRNAVHAGAMIPLRSKRNDWRLGSVYLDSLCVDPLHIPPYSRLIGACTILYLAHKLNTIVWFAEDKTLKREQNINRQAGIFT